MSQVSDFPPIVPVLLRPRIVRAVFRVLVNFLGVWVVGCGWLAEGHNRPKYVYYSCLLDMFGFAPKCMGEGGGKVTQTILVRKYSGT